LPPTLGWNSACPTEPKPSSGTADLSNRANTDEFGPSLTAGLGLAFSRPPFEERFLHLFNRQDYVKKLLFRTHADSHIGMDSPRALQSTASNGDLVKAFREADERFTADDYPGSRGVLADALKAANASIHVTVQSVYV
jgi:hypothetical protein